MPPETPKMKKEAISKRCLLLLYPLTVIIIGIAIITITTISYPSVLFTAHNPGSLPPSIHNQISHLQSQLGSILEQFHSETLDSKISKYSDQLLRIAVSVEKLANDLSHVYDATSSSNVSDGSDTSYKEEDEEADEGLLSQRVSRSNELLNYTSPKPNRHGAKNFLGVEAIYPTIGLACTGATMDVERYMDYEIFGPCPDDWAMAQKLMVGGCDPPPRRRCFSKSPQHYNKPHPINSSLWSLPNEDNILWTHYKCKGLSCLVSKETIGKRGFFKCSDCFDFSKRSWLTPSNGSSSAEFTIDEVLALKPTEIRIGLDFSPTTGTFAATMREKNVTIVSATLNLGAPFSEVIALRGLLPLYISIGSRLPFFDNTLDIIHSTLFLDGWIGFELLEYVLFDWDRVLRPNGLLWVDRFFCTKDSMKGYLDVFAKLGYKKLLWRTVPKKDKGADELFLSAVLEKTPRA